MHSFKNRLIDFFIVLAAIYEIPLFLGISIVVLLLKANDPPPQKETWCAQIRQYDSVSHKVITYYTPATVKEVDLLSIKLAGNKKYTSKDFLTGGELDYNLHANVITKTGSQFEIKLIQEGNCRSKSEMDSLAKSAEENESNQ